MLQDEFITSAEAAEALKLSARTLSRWHRLRIGPPRIKVGRKVYYRCSAVDGWLRAQEIQAAQHD